MAEKLKSRKRSPRIHPCKPIGVPSKGLRKAKRHPLTELEKVLLGKGGIQRLAAARAKEARR